MKEVCSLFICNFLINIRWINVCFHNKFILKYHLFSLWFIVKWRAKSLFHPDGSLCLGSGVLELISSQRCGIKCQLWEPQLVAVTKTLCGYLSWGKSLIKNYTYSTKTCFLRLISSLFSLSVLGVCLFV
jgi:hypothetical protein